MSGVVAPFGAWRSPLGPADAARGATRFPGLGITLDAAGAPVIWWAETRPEEAGRVVILHTGPNGAAVEVGPRTMRVRSRVNEYGGGAFWVTNEQLFAVEEVSQRVMAVDLVDGRAPATDRFRPNWLTATPPASKVWRHAAGSSAAGSDWLVVERERHVDHSFDPLREPVNELLAIHRARKGLRVLVGPEDTGGGDFVAAPTVSPDGDTLAWLRWDHPDMPWDAAELWAGRLQIDDDGARLLERRRVAGGRAGAAARGVERPVSVCLPEWAPDGRLWWCDDSTDWWHLYATVEPGLPVEGSGDRAAPLVRDAQEEVGEPRWVAGGHRFGFADDGRIVAVASSGGIDGVWILDPRTGERSPLPGVPFTSVELVQVLGSTVAIIGGAADRPTTVWRIDLDTGDATDLRGASAPLDPDWISAPTSITFPTGRPDGPEAADLVAHALFYPPVSGDHVGPDGELPPLIVRIHGGPTAAARPEFSTSIQFWTTRGFAVVDVNYRGSVGYGRRYRDELLGNWGVVEVEDCLAVTRHLAADGEVDGERCVIRGGSSGGFTALGALCNQADWGYDGALAGACSLYGVSDLASMVADTHKFESRYIDGLVAPLPEGDAVYRERSPLFHADRLDRPVLLLQGSEDVIVPVSQAEVLVDALERNGVPHAYVLFEGEGHGFHRSQTVVRALEAELGFYGTVLGFEPDGLPGPFELN